MKFKRILATMGSVLLIGATVTAAGLSGMPWVNNGNVDAAAVYGQNSEDGVSATSVGDTLLGQYEAPETTTVFTGEGVTEDEIPLGGSIVDGKIHEVLTDNKVPSLIDGKLQWDDGESTEDEFNIREEIRVGDVEVKTTLDDNEFEGVALTNDKGLEYRYVFEEGLNTDRIGHEDANDLVVEVLGKEYTISEVTSDSITVVTSEEVVAEAGSTHTVGDVTLTVKTVFEDHVMVNDVLVEEGQIKKVDGVKVEVVNIGYSNTNQVAILRVGEEIEETYEDGDAYPGEDEDEPTWVWSISNPGEEDGYIGVKYDRRDTTSDDDEMVVYTEGSYVFPENYAVVSLDAVTTVDYSDYEVTFDDDATLYGEEGSEKLRDDVPAVYVSGPEDDSLLVGEIETDKLALYYNPETAELEVYARDAAEDVDDRGRVRLVDTVELDDLDTPVKVAELTNDDTTVDVTAVVSEGRVTLGFDNSVNTVNVLLGGDLIDEEAETGTLEHLGVEAEDAENGEVAVDDNSVGTEENDVMDHYGMILKTPETNGEDDLVVLSVPSDRVYAKVSVAGSVTETEVDTEAETPTVVVKDANVADVQDKNLIVVGGSCVNTVAAKLLESDTPLCGADFTAKTGVGEGQALVKVFESPYNSEKVAVLVAGYSKADTDRAVNALTTGELDLTVGAEHTL
jgi:hypothetical protein